MTQAVIYTRFSPRRNAGESESCETQEQLCRELAEKQGLEVVAVYHDREVSGDTWPRPNLEAAIDALSKDGVLLVYRRDRIARSVLLAELVRRSLDRIGAKILATQGEAAQGDSPEAVFVRQILDAVAELERKQISARTRAALRAKQRAGKRVSYHVPYGSKVDPEDDTRLVTCPEEAKTVRRIMQLHDDGLSPWKIGQRLHGEGHKPRKKSWNEKTIRRIIRRTLE